MCQLINRKRKMRKRQVINFAIPSASVANVLITDRVQVDTSYWKVIGYTLYENANLGAGINYQVKLEDDNQVYHDLTKSDDFIAGTGVDKRGRYNECNFKADGNFVTVTIKPLANTTQDGNLDFVLLLEGRKGTDCNPDAENQESCGGCPMRENADPGAAKQ